MVNVIDEESRVVDPDNLDHQISEYLKLKASIEFMETRQRELREKLFGAIEELGFEDDKGNIQLELDQEINGIVRLEKQRRVSRKIDETVAEELIAELGLEDQLYKTIRVVDEDELMAAVYQGKITDEQLDAMYPPKIVWALMTKKS